MTWQGLIEPCLAGHRSKIMDFCIQDVVKAKTGVVSSCVGLVSRIPPAIVIQHDSSNAA